MRIRYTRQAYADLDGVYDYIACDNPKAALKVLDRVQEVASRLAQFPRSGVKKADEENVFVAPLGRYPYLVYFTVENDELSILHVRHAKRLPPGPLKR